ncbi:MAG TPA: hypothetical protein PLJ98_07990 [Acholeplasmataceae bacterium]|nr:hypothetical protein [Acholeplasmataceae bacterium]
MALKLEIQTSSGVHVNYHRIISTNINWVTNKVTFTVASYLSEYMRRNDKEPVETMDINVVLDLQTNKNKESLLITLYTWLKENAIGFDKAEDC